MRLLKNIRGLYRCKRFIYKVLPLVIGGVFLISNMLYGIELSDIKCLQRSCLRRELDFNNRVKNEDISRYKEAMDEISGDSGTAGADKVELKDYVKRREEFASDLWTGIKYDFPGGAALQTTHEKVHLLARLGMIESYAERLLHLLRIEPFEDKERSVAIIEELLPYENVRAEKV